MNATRKVNLNTNSHIRSLYFINNNVRLRLIADISDRRGTLGVLCTHVHVNTLNMCMQWLRNVCLDTLFIQRAFQSKCKNSWSGSEHLRDKIFTHSHSAVSVKLRRANWSFTETAECMVERVEVFSLNMTAAMHYTFMNTNYPQNSDLIIVPYLIIGVNFIQLICLYTFHCKSQGSTPVWERDPLATSLTWETVSIKKNLCKALIIP